MVLSLFVTATGTARFAVATGVRRADRAKVCGRSERQGIDKWKSSGLIRYRDLQLVA
jgi:hypothetical protein